jgi:hypothetical protein
MLIDLIGTSFCEVAIDEERSYVSGRMDDKIGMATCYPEYFVTALVSRLQSIRITIRKGGYLSKSPNTLCQALPNY